MALVQVQVAFRHGSRTPVDDSGCIDDTSVWRAAETDKAAMLSTMGTVRLFKPSSGDAIDPMTMFKQSSGAAWGGTAGTLRGGGHAGELTRIGLQQAVDLGTELRSRYMDCTAEASASVRPAYLLPQTYENARRLVVVRSTRVERTVFTAQGVLAGLFPAAAADGSLSTDIMLSGKSDKCEYMVLNDAVCPRLRDLFQRGLTLSTLNRDAAQEAVLDMIEEATDWRCGSGAWSLICYRDWWACLRAAGKPVPEVVEQLAPALDHVTARQMHCIFEAGAEFSPDGESTSVEAVRLAIGRMLKQVVDTLERPDGCMHLYSGHDWTVTPLLLSVAKQDEPGLRSWPPFCSNIAFELWSSRAQDVKGVSHYACEGDAAMNNEGKHVRVLYNGSPVALRCTDAGRDTCSLADFKQMVDAYCVRDFAAECACTEHPISGGAKPSFNK